MVFPAIVAVVRNAAIFSSVLLTPFGWNTSTSSSSSPSPDKVLSSKTLSHSSRGSRGLFPWGTNNYDWGELSFFTGCSVGSLMGGIVGYWLAVKIQRWRVKERLRYWKSQFTKTKEKENGEDQRLSESSSLERPIQLLKLNGVSINLESHKTSNKNIQKSTSSTVQPAVKDELHAILRHVISPRTSLTASLYSYSIELPTGSTWDIPTSNGVQLFYVLGGCGSLLCPCSTLDALSKEADIEKSTSHEEKQHHEDQTGRSWNGWKNALLQVVLDRGSNIHYEDGDFSPSTPTSKLSQGDVFVIEPWSKNMQIANDALGKGSDMPTRSNYFNAVCPAGPIHILCVSDIKSEYDSILSSALPPANSDASSSSLVFASSSPAAFSNLTDNMGARGYGILSKSMDIIKNWRK